MVSLLTRSKNSQQDFDPVKHAIRSVGSRTYKCKYIDVTSIFCISGVEIHFDSISMCGCEDIPY